LENAGGFITSCCNACQHIRNSFISEPIVQQGKARPEIKSRPLAGRAKGLLHVTLLTHPSFGKFSSDDGLREYQCRWRHRTSIVFVFSNLVLRQNNASYATKGHTPVLSCIVVALFSCFLPISVARFSNAVCSVSFLATGLLTANLGHGYVLVSWSRKHLWQRGTCPFESFVPI
jgi:hypothetical protein